MEQSAGGPPRHHSLAGLTGCAAGPISAHAVAMRYDSAGWKPLAGVRNPFTGGSSQEIDSSTEQDPAERRICGMTPWNQNTRQSQAHVNSSGHSALFYSGLCAEDAILDIPLHQLPVPHPHQDFSHSVKRELRAALRCSCTLRILGGVQFQCLLAARHL